MTENLFPDGKTNRKRARRNGGQRQKARLESLFVALVELCGADRALMTPSEERWYWMTAGELLRKRVPASPEDIGIVAAGILAKWGAKCVTPGAIVKHFSEFVSGTATDRRLKREADSRLKEGLRTQQNIRRVRELDAATLNGYRGQIGGWYATAPIDNSDFCERICKLMDESESQAAGETKP